VFYDGACGLCLPAVAVMRRLDLLRRVAFVDVVSDWAAISHRLPDLTRGRCLTEMHAVTSDGRTFAGWDACRAVARSLPLGWVIGPLRAVAPASQTAGESTAGSRLDMLPPAIGARHRRRRGQLFLDPPDSAALRNDLSRPCIEKGQHA
jgi:predicted DCC family thiol-disulfide oxidoreductase YuxK